MRAVYFFVLALLISGSALKAQLLQPGFSKEEYIETLKVNYKVHIALDQWATNTNLSYPTNFRFVYRSPRVGFDNIWDLWVHQQKRIAIIALQGTTTTEASFLANLYAAMVPAKGELELDQHTHFPYTLSQDPRAAVHVGWLVAMAYMAPGIRHKIDSCYKAGIKDFY